MIMIESRKAITNVGGSQLHPQDLPDTDVPNDGSDYFQSIQQSSHSSSFRKMEAPFQLLLETFREEEDQNLFIMTQISPDQTFYMSSCLKRSDVNINHFYKLHRHDFYELLYVAEGEVYQNIENSRHYYPAGSCCLLNPNVYHTEENSSSQRIIFLDLQKDYLESLLHGVRYFEAEKTPQLAKLSDFLQNDRESGGLAKEYMDFIPLPGTVNDHDYLHRQLEKIFMLMENPTNGSSFILNGLLLSLLCHLFDESCYRHAPMQFASSQEEELFRDITAYLQVCHGRASRRQLQEHFHYSGDYLYKLVKKFTGLSLFDYAMSITLKEAADLLTATSVPVSELISRLGFSNQTHFYKLFKERYGMSPARYRSSFREKA